MPRHLRSWSSFRFPRRSSAKIYEPSGCSNNKLVVWIMGCECIFPTEYQWMGCSPKCGLPRLMEYLAMLQSPTSRRQHRCRDPGPTTCMAYSYCGVLSLIPFPPPSSRPNHVLPRCHSTLILPIPSRQHQSLVPNLFSKHLFR